MKGRNILFVAVGLSILGLFVLVAPTEAAGLDSRVNESFRGPFIRNPTVQENTYWRGRVADKKTFEALQGAMFFHKAQGRTMGTGRVNDTTTASKGDDKQTLIKDTLTEFIKVYGNDPSNTEKAWWRKRISCGEITTRTALVNSMKYHKSKKARKGGDGICGGTTSASSSSSGGVSSKAIDGTGGHIMGPQVRINIYKTDSGGTVKITSNGKYQIREGSSKIRATLDAGKEIQISWSGGKYHVRGSGVNFDTEQEIHTVPLNLAIMQIKSYSDKSTTIAGKNYNRFRGKIVVKKCDGSSELAINNVLRTEYYLRGLAESSDTGPEEYLKTLGIAARTYVLYHKVVTGGRNSACGYDITNTSDDQIYRGHEYEIITPRLASTFNKVKGIVVTGSEADNLVSTVYFSDSDGRTRSAKEKWGTDRFPHLQHSVKDPHHVSDKCQGHCVGLPAQGAYGLAKKDGWSFQKILKYFYLGVNLVRVY